MLAGCAAPGSGDVAANHSEDRLSEHEQCPLDGAARVRFAPLPRFRPTSRAEAQSLSSAEPITTGPDAGSFEQKGKASWYGRMFHGRKTASGEKFNMNAMTAAHRTLPLASWVRVTNKSNHKTVVVKINDRGPYVRGRVIDLSYAAAAVLGMRGAGTQKVKIEGLTQQEARAAREEQAQALADDSVN